MGNEMQKERIQSIMKSIATSGGSLEDVMDLWCKVWVATAGSNSCSHESTATSYADNAVIDYYERFYGVM